MAHWILFHLRMVGTEDGTTSTSVALPQILCASPCAISVARTDRCPFIIQCSKGCSFASTRCPQVGHRQAFHTKTLGIMVVECI